VIGAVALSASLATSSLLAAPARVTLAASPTHVALAAGGRQAVRISATGGGSLTVEARVAGFGLDLRGRPRIAAAGDAAPWLSVRPRMIRVGRAGGVVVVSARRPTRARPGDHSALVLLSAVAPSARGVVVRMRIGLVISVRVAGRVVHRVAILKARVRRAGRARLLELTLANRGNVIEALGAGSLRVTLVRRGRVVAHYFVARRELLPRTRGVVELRYSGRAHGLMTARIELWRTAHPWAVRLFRLRL
jgi:hypothetical protein